MALNSPGVEVQVIDESFYASPEPSTRPLIIVATATNKVNGSSTGIARGTLAANAGRPYLITSQRELVDTFGIPTFYRDSNSNPIHGMELNEYGLQAAYSFLGIANSAYVMRADIDLSELQSQFDAPGANPAAGTYWLDTQNTRVGIFEWNGTSAKVTGGQKFSNKIPRIITDVTDLEDISDPTSFPRTSLGKPGDYALVTLSNLNKLYFKNRNNNWVIVGSNDWHSSWPTVKGSRVAPDLTNSVGSQFTINGTLVECTSSDLSALATAINNLDITGISAAVVDKQLEIYSNGMIDSSTVDSVSSNLITIGAGPVVPGLTPLVASDPADSALGIAIGPYYGPRLVISPHTSVPRFKSVDDAPRPTGSVWIKTTDVNLGARWRTKVWNTNTESWDNVAAPLYANNVEALYRLDRSGGGANVPTGTLYVQFNYNQDDGTDETPRIATFRIMRRVSTSPTTITSNIIKGDVIVNNVPVSSGTFDNDIYTFEMAETRPGFTTLEDFKTITLDLGGVVGDAKTIVDTITLAGFRHIRATVDERNRVSITHDTGGEIYFRDGVNTPLALMGFQVFDVALNTGTPNLYQDPFDPFVESMSTMWYIASNWKPLVYVASEDPPTSLPEDGRLWYSSRRDEVDIMIHNGTRWVGYLHDGSNNIAASPYYNSNEGLQTDPNGPIITATKPTTQTDGSALVRGDIWLDSGDSENYPALYRWDDQNLIWLPIDNTDQTTEDGIIFADARYNTAGANSGTPGTIRELLVSNFVDFDSPDPDLYPRGMLLFNTRRSGANVKRFVRNYIDIQADNVRMFDETMEEYYPHRWVNESGNDENGAGLFVRKAQRKAVIRKLKSVVDSNQDIRDWERRTFNLIACPGYPELIANMVNLNIDRKQTAFVIGDTPFRLTNDATTLNEWGTNANLAVDNGEDGLVTYDSYLGVYYPSGFTTDNFGNDIVVPASHMVLRTIALSDNTSFPWFAPAGTRRGGVTNATSIGYVDAVEGEFRSIALNEGQRDALYLAKINPITVLTGSGIIIFGQKTRARLASALDRINVARLVIYLRGQLDRLARPYIFEPNDKITRDEIKADADSLMLDLVGKRAIYDFVTVCDESNNTPARIDRNELWLDIAIEPVKAIEFIYIPLRLKNTGEIGGIVNPTATSRLAQGQATN